MLTQKIQASSYLLLLYSRVCVGPGRNPENWFSHDAAQFMSYLLLKPECRFLRDAAYFMENMQSVL